MVKAKFRCLNKTVTWDHVITYRFRPVYAHNGEGESEENKKFWSATPSGELELTFQELADPDYKVGGYYYILMTPWESRPPTGPAWRVERVDKVLNGQTSVSIYPAWDHARPLRSAHLQMGINNPAASDMFELGSKWDVELEQTV